MKRIFAILGVILLLAAAVWQFALKNNFNQRFPDAWVWELSSLGHSSYAGDNGQFPDGTRTEDDPINITERQVSVVSKTSDAQVVLRDHYLNLDPVTRNVTWEVTYEATVDQMSGQYREGELAGDYYFLPQNLDRNQTYTISNSTYQHILMSFQRGEVVNAVNTYMYAYYGSFDNHLAYPDIPLEANQTIRCNEFTLEYWAEPNTGEIVKVREWCEGDFVVDTSTGESLYGISRWGAETNTDDLIRRGNEVQNILFQWQLRNLYLPIILSVLGLVFLIYGGLGMRSKA